MQLTFLTIKFSLETYKNIVKKKTFKKFNSNLKNGKNNENQH